MFKIIKSKIKYNMSTGYDISDGYTIRNSSNINEILDMFSDLTRDIVSVDYILEDITYDAFELLDLDGITVKLVIYKEVDDE